jgi:hypothetical protein
VHRDEQPGQPFGGPEGGQRLGGIAARELQPPARLMARNSGRRFDLATQRALGVVQQVSASSRRIC